MKTLPSLIIVADRGHLVAYVPTERDTLQKIDEAHFAEGNLKLSEMVTDQSGAFPNVGTPGTGSHERMPLIAELEMRCFRQIADKIHQLVDRVKPGSWGFATPSEINGAILDGLGNEYRRTLVVNLRLDLVNSTPANIAKRFLQMPREVPAS